MAVIETSIVISRPVEAVYSFVTNLDNMKLLQQGIKAINLNGPFGVGTRYTVKTEVMGREFSAENEIVALEPNKKFAVKTLASPPASPVTTTYLLEPSGGGTKLTTQMDTVVTGGFPGVEDMVKNQLKTTLDGLNATMKKVIEG
jgi:carbon monoxide dehydrogenase subunit G